MAVDRSTRRSAHKRPRSVAHLDAAERAIRRLLTTDEVVSHPTEEIPAVPVRGTGVERPVPEWVDLSQPVWRCFAFVDVCGFTSFTDRYGTKAAVEVLTRFRAACRDVAARRGVRVTKWLGDGAMIVATDPGAVVATAAELLLRFADDPFEVHAGVAGGPVLLFEGDDYIGRSVNTAARLCEAAAPGEILCSGLDEVVPDWVDRAGSVAVRAVGIGDILDVTQLRVTDDAWAHPEPAPHHPSAVGE